MPKLRHRDAKCSASPVFLCPTMQKQSKPKDPRSPPGGELPERKSIIEDENRIDNRKRPRLVEGGWHGVVLANPPAEGLGASAQSIWIWAPS